MSNHFQLLQVLLSNPSLIKAYLLRHGVAALGKKLFYLLVLIYAFHAFLKSHGWLSKKSVKGEHIFITGAGSGIGRQMALKFARRGARITVCDLNLDNAKKVEKEILDKGGEALAVYCNVTVLSDVKEAAAKAIEKFGDVTILINNAGIVTGKKLLDSNEKLIETTIAVNTTSHAYTVREFLPSMLKKNHGHIVTVASVAGLVGVNGLADYCASKFGAVGFDESLRMELSQLKTKVRTTCICPYYINTGMFDGVQSKVPLLFPILSEQYASNRIVNAILQNESVMVMPWSCNLIQFLRAIFPVSVFDFICNLLGANSSMDKFKGRGTAKEILDNKA